MIVSSYWCKDCKSFVCRREYGKGPIDIVPEGIGCTYYTTKEYVRTPTIKMFGREQLNTVITKPVVKKTTVMNIDKFISVGDTKWTSSKPKVIQGELF